MNVKCAGSIGCGVVRKSVGADFLLAQVGYGERNTLVFRERMKKHKEFVICAMPVVLSEKVLVLRQNAHKKDTHGKSKNQNSYCDFRQKQHK